MRTNVQWVVACIVLGCAAACSTSDPKEPAGTSDGDGGASSGMPGASSGAPASSSSSGGADASSSGSRLAGIREDLQVGLQKCSRVLPLARAKELTGIPLADLPYEDAANCSYRTADGITLVDTNNFVLWPDGRPSEFERVCAGATLRPDLGPWACEKPSEDGVQLFVVAYHGWHGVTASISSASPRSREDLSRMATALVVEIYERLAELPQVD